MIDKYRPNMGVDHKRRESLRMQHLSASSQTPEYKILSGYTDRFRGELSGESLRAYYVHLTDDLIQRVICGPDDSIVGVDTGGPADSRERESEVHRLKPYYDSLIFLDKSARPVEWLLKALWEHLAKMPNGDSYEIPSRFFANIDRLHWSGLVDPSGIENRDISKGSSDLALIIPGLRAIYEQNKAFESNSDDSKRMLIVDEVRSTGRTLSYAMAMFKEAFPAIEFEGHHWMSGVGTNGFTPEGNVVTGTASIPVWYNDQTILGRGVGDPDRSKLRKGKMNLRDTGRAYFLSTRLPVEDRESSDKLRREIETLAQDVVNHRIMVRPSYVYNSEAYLARAQQLNPEYGDDTVALTQELKHMGAEWAIKPKQ